MILALSFVACGGEASVEPEETNADVVEPLEEEGEGEDVSFEIPEFSVEIIGAEADVFTNVEAADFEIVEFEAVKTKKDGTEETNVFKGIALKDVLAFAGVTEYTSVTVEASDGYGQDYTPEIVEGETILAFYQDGELLSKAGPIQLVPKGQSGNMWIKQFCKITINE